MTLSEIEAQKEHREFRLQQAKEKLFPEMRKRKAPEESELEGGNSEDEQEHGKVPCDACRERKLACEWSGTSRIKACDRCRGFRKSCRVNGVGHRAPRLKKMRVIRDSEEEAGEPTMPVKAEAPKAKSVPVAGNSSGSGVRVGSGGTGNGVALEDASLRAPLVDLAHNLRRVIRQNAEFREEFSKAQHTQMDLLANLCGSMREISYQLHLRNIMFE
jgi:hypothetical protein